MEVWVSSGTIGGLLYVRDSWSQGNHDWSELEQNSSGRFEH